ncbi:MAG: glycosyltransferase family 2 protein [Bacteroidaceae bacterium]|nr:glycosyltransferase family 2 protein [Bacteroidaceae bacterium]
MTDQKPRISVVILNWNGVDMLKRFLPGVVKCSPEAEVVVADNASTDGSLGWLSKEMPEVRQVVLDRNHGFADGYNHGLKPVEAEYYVLLNSDVEVTEGWLSPMLSYMDEHPEVAACQPKLRCQWDKQMLEYAGACGGYIDWLGYPFCRGRVQGKVEKDEGQYDTIAPVLWASGAALMIRSNDYWQAGGLDGRFFAHQEEIDLCWRLRSRGRGIVCIPQSVVFHVGGGTLPKENPRKTYLNFRNNLLLLYKNLSDKELKRVMWRRRGLDALASVFFLLKGQWGSFKAVWKGRRDFNRMRPDFEKDRKENLRLTMVDPIPEVYPKCILWHKPQV